MSRARARSGTARTTGRGRSRRETDARRRSCRPPPANRSRRCVTAESSAPVPSRRLTLVAKTRGYPPSPSAESSPNRSTRYRQPTTRDAAEERAGNDVDQRQAAANEPTKTFARLTRRVAMPPSAMMPPASTKNGIASSAKSSVPSEILSMTASSGCRPTSPRSARTARARTQPERRAHTGQRTIRAGPGCPSLIRAPRRRRGT